METCAVSEREEDSVMRGAQKQMIVLRTGGSRYFDEAYFVLKSGRRPRREEGRDMVREANRILDESENGGAEARRRGSRHRGFLTGVLVGAPAGAVLLWLAALARDFLSTL